MSERVYIHEFIDIIGPNRARYMHHMTANWVPIAIEERNQHCFGVWGTVGSTGRWPEVVNLWELDGWDGLVANLEHELSGGAGLQDPSLAAWWEVAAGLRRGGVDRIVVARPWSPTIAELLADGVRGAVYAHELVTVPIASADAYLELVREQGIEMMNGFGARLVGAFKVAMVSDTEAIVIWAFAGLDDWARFEHEWTDGTALDGWRARADALGASVARTLMVDAPLAPLRLGRQPEVGDRRPLDEV
jgi:hypothetical protein